jgi:DNA-directed RNA polymerase
MHPRLLEQLADSMTKFVHPAHLPMLVEPKPWAGPFTGGFLKQQVCVMRTLPGHRSQVSLLRHADLGRVYEALDVLGSTRWRINGFIKDTVAGVWASGGGIAEVPSLTDVPLPEPPTPEEMASMPGDMDRKRALKRHRLALNMAVRTNADLHSLRCDMKLKMSVAERFQADTVYFPHNVDFRGRAYPVPPHLNHMGADVCRGLLTFADSKPLGERGLRWLKIHLSNLMGKDKISMDDRAAYTEANMAEVMDSADRPLNGNGWWLKADAPWQALAACKELTSAYRSGNAVEYSSPLPVHQDGSCNGLQHYAALGRDERGGRAVNLLPVPGEDRPQDVYSRVLALVVKRLEADASGANLSPAVKTVAVSSDVRDRMRRAAGRPAAAGSGLDPTSPVAAAFASGSLPEVYSAVVGAPDGSELQGALKERIKMLAAQFLQGAVDRKVVKQTVMTSVYGVTFIGAREQILNRLREKFSAAPATAAGAQAAAAAVAAAAAGGVGDGPVPGAAVLPPHALQVDELETVLFVCASYLARTTLDSLGDLFTSADAIKRWLGEVAGLVALAEQPMSWITPLGLPVVQPYRREKSMTVKTLIQDLVVVDSSEQLPVSVARQRSAFPPNYVHSLDSTHMMLTALDCAKGRGLTFAAVHDSYWTHPRDIDTMNASLRQQFVNLYSMPLLETFRASLIARFPSIPIPELPPRGTLDLEQVKSSTYFFS